MSVFNSVLIISILQFAMALGLLNVWLVRFNKSTKYRGGSAKNMKEEFKVYGLPSSFVYLVGFLKLIISFVFLMGLMYPLFASLVLPASYLLSFLMIGAIVMHVKVKDSFVKMLPALMMFLMSITVIILINNLI